MLGVTASLFYLTRETSNLWLAAALLSLGIVALAWVLARRDPALGECEPQNGADLSSRATESWTPVLPLVLATVATAIGADRSLGAGRSEPVGWDIGVPWLIGIALFAAAAWWPTIRASIDAVGDGPRPARRPPSGRRWMPWAAILPIAALPRLAWLDRFPTMIDGDEGQYLLAAVAARTGNMTNPFTTGWFGIPNLYPAAGGWLAHLTGADLVGHRALGALVGTVGVIATWRYGRRVVGPWPAIVGAGLMATLPFHLHFSRTALAHIMDPTTLIFALLFLWRGVHDGRRGDAFLCGVMVGIGWYGYWGARVYPVIVALILVIVATDRRLGLRGAIRLGAWSAVGFVATTMPLLMSLVRNPGEFQNRLAATSPFSLGAWRDDPGAVLELYVTNLRDSLFFPFFGNEQIFFRNPAPFLGWPMALLVAIGVSVWIAAALLRKGGWRNGAWLFVPWVVLTLGVATTYPVQSQRFMALTPFWALAAGSGLVAIARWVTAVYRPAPIAAARIATVAAVALLALTNLAWIASEDRQITTYGDARTFAAWDIGWRLANGDSGEAEGPPVLFAGSPFMFIGSWANLRFQAPNANLADVLEPMPNAASVPPLLPGTLLLIVGERTAEQCAVLQAYPGVTVAEVRSRQGQMLYLAFYRGALPGWATASTPGETTFTIVEPSACDAKVRRVVPS
ncbi:MAG TPA: glycosyltransferase family 39 protein [Gaiellaceae bacterium]|nr:glycosyltransferase family 39 protein [Gaiellaceae bacterium]